MKLLKLKKNKKVVHIIRAHTIGLYQDYKMFAKLFDQYQDTNLLVKMIVEIEYDYIKN